MKDGRIKNGRIKRWLKGFIPSVIGNGPVIAVLEFLRKLQRLFVRGKQDHRKQNRSAFKDHEQLIRKTRGFIEDQNSLGRLSFGKFTMNYSGCEVIAVYNAVKALEGTADLPQLIHDFEADGMLLSGRFGTSPGALRDYLKKQGYETEFTTREVEFERIAASHEVSILTFYNDRKDITCQVHTVMISKEDGKYTAHNVYCNGHTHGPCDTVEALIGGINGGRAKGISLLGIDRKSKEMK